MQTATLATVVPPPLWQTIALAAGPACIVAITAIAGQILAHRFAMRRERISAIERERDEETRARVRYYSDFLYQLEQAEYLIALLHYDPYGAPSDTPQDLRETFALMRQARHRLITVESKVGRLVAIEKICNAVSACTHGLPDRLTDHRSKFADLGKPIEYIAEQRREIEITLSLGGHIRHVWHMKIPRADELLRAWKNGDKPVPSDSTD